MVSRLSLLGPPRLLDGQGRLISLPAKTYALVAYLLLNHRGEPATRASLRQFLWEDSDTKAAATNMRKFLSRIVERQRQCGVELIRNRRDHVELSASTHVDLTDFLRLVSLRTSADLVALCDLYRGDLLEGHDWEGTEVQSWLSVQRANLRDAFVGAVASWLEPLDPGADKVAIRVAARRLLDVDPYNEVAHRALMRLFAEDREPARISDLYKNLRTRLQEDLGVSPDEATTALYESLLPGRGPATTAPLRVEPKSSAPTIPDQEETVSEGEAVAIPDRSGAPRVTVLPPPPIAGQDYGHQLAVSLIEDVTIGLCRSKSLSIVAPHTAWELSQSGKRALLRKFKIDYSVETQLQNRSGELWLVVKLLNANTRDILWVEQYQFDPNQMARQYRELSLRIVLLLVDTIERNELALYTTEHDAKAYHLYLAGQRYLRKLDLPNVRRARRLFRAATGTCPDFVPALSSLAQTYQREWLLMARGDQDLIQEAERLAVHCIDVDPDDARGYRELGVCSLYSGRFDESLQAFEQAELRNAQHADVLVDFADALEHACEPSKALQKVNRAVGLNPLCPDWYWWVAGGANFHLQRYNDALDCMSRMRDPSPAYRLIAASWALLGDREKAQSFVRKTKEIHPDFSVSSWLSILPIRDPEYAKHYEQGLREAGFS